MPRFVANPIHVNCVQFLGDIAPWPESFRLAVRRFLAGGLTEIMTGDGVRPVRYGDWIVHGPDGLFTVWHESQFEQWFSSEARPVFEEAEGPKRARKYNGG